MDIRAEEISRIIRSQIEGFDAQLNRGQRLVEILKQPQYKPVPVEKQVAVLWTATNGFIDDIPVKEVRRFETELLEYLDVNAADALKRIKETGQFSDETKAELKTAVTAFKESFTASLNQPQGVGA